VTTRTTFSALTAAAAEHLRRAVARIEQHGLQDREPGESNRAHEGGADRAQDVRTGAGKQPDSPVSEEPAHAAIRAHRDLSSALAHLGRVLARPPARTSARAAAPSRRGHPPARTLRDLQRRGLPRDWSAHAPEEGSAARDLHDASRAIRAAADLWATHQTPAGSPRSAEASRMRHPSMLGAATREWGTLVNAAADVAEVLHGRAREPEPPLHGPGPGPNEDGQDPRCAAPLDPLRAYPRPSGRHRSGAEERVDITVARPGNHPHDDPMARVSDRVDRLRQVAWNLAESGKAPAPALANLAAVGVMLNRVAADALDRAAQAGPLNSARATLEESARHRRTAHARWCTVAARVDPLRTPHPPNTALQIERLDLARLVDDVMLTARGQGSREVAEGLSTLAGRYDEVAELNLRGFRAAHKRGEVHVLGQALPPEALVRRPDLLEAKLTRRLVPAPAALTRRLEEAYEALGRERAGVRTEDGVA
jgi:hypothetical protein